MCERFQLHRSFSFPQRILLSSQERIEQSELRATRAVPWTVSYEFFDSWPGGLELRLRFGGVSAHQENTRLKVAFRQWHSRLRIDVLELASGKRFLRGIRIAIHQADVPARERDDTVWIEIFGE